jgi:chemotaxis protein methyltransferase CheR
MSMDAALFNSLSIFLKGASGLVLSPDKIYLANSRLQPVADKHGCVTVADLVRKLVTSAAPRLKQDVVEAMTTNETSFFRDTTPFETFKSVVLPNLIERRKDRRRLRILCAAASSGQEPYSLAMILAENEGRMQGWSTEILGIDIDENILQRASEALYSQFEVQRGLPVQYLMKYFDQADKQAWRLKPAIRQKVTFRKRNLLEPIGDLGQFDVIFCRNVLIYFDLPTKRSVLQRLSDIMPADGSLFLGGAETVLDISECLAPSPGHRGLYRLLPASSAVAASPVRVLAS